MIYRKHHLNFRYQVLCSIGLFLLTGVLLGGCAVAPQPSIDAYIEPIAERFNAQINPETGAATVVKEGVAVSIKPIDEVELFGLTEDPRMNPYLIVERNGAVEPIYTVFEMVAHNRDNNRVVVEDMAILMDANGAQYANLSNDYFDSLYDNVNVARRDPWHAGYPYGSAAYHSYYGYYQSYVDAEALEWGQIVIEDTIFESGKLFSGAKRSGLIIFDRLEPDATELRIVVPEIRIVHPNGKEDTLKFKIDFRQVLP